jgi:nucleoside-diphosphate-sugar epimerase
VKALVTGGKGFVGRAVAEALLAEGADVRVASRSAAEGDLAGAESVAMDLTRPEDVRRAVEGCDTVFHVAAMTGVWGPRRHYFAANVEGTRNVLAAALESGVRRLVYTSSPSVCFDGKDHSHAGNDLPYAERFLCAYPESKAVAEREVLAANGREGAGGGVLSTCALRPHLVVGPGDPHLVPRLVDRARAGRLPVVGDGENEVSVTDVENAARAHVLAARELGPGSPQAGKAYFVAQSEPVRLWPWLAELFRALDVPEPTRSVSRGTAYAAGAVCEGLWRALPLPGEPPMTRFVALQLSSTHSYDLGPAREDFGYEERISMPETTERIVASFRGRA